MMSVRRLYDEHKEVIWGKFDDIYETFILKLRWLYGYEAVSNFSEAVIYRHEAVI